MTANLFNQAQCQKVATNEKEEAAECEKQKWKRYAHFFLALLRANHKRAPLGLSFLLFETGSANDKSSLRPCETNNSPSDQSFGKKCYVFWE